MDHFLYRNGILHAEGVAIPDIATAVGTPFYCYSTATLTRHYRVFSEAFSGLDALVCYSMKANSNQAVIRTLAKLGAGADVALPFGSHADVCPVRALEAWRVAAGVQEGALFRSVDRHGRVGGRLDGRDVARMLKVLAARAGIASTLVSGCLLYTSPSPRDRTRSRMPSSA